MATYIRKTNRDFKKPTGYAGHAFKEYKAPSGPDELFRLPDSLEQIVKDLEKHGGVLRNYLSKVDNSGVYHNQILCQIYMRLDDKKSMKQRWDKLISVGEVTQCMLVSEQLMTMALNDKDLTAMKFVLQTRFPEKFGKAASGAGGQDNLGEKLSEIEKDRQTQLKALTLPDYLSVGNGKR